MGLSNAQMKVDEALVWGLYLTGSSYQQIKSLLTAMELHVPCFPRFQKLESELSENFERAVQLILKRNGEEERKAAIDQGDYIMVGEE